jgi:hypothetical protein
MTRSHPCLFLVEGERVVVDLRLMIDYFQVEEGVGEQEHRQMKSLVNHWEEVAVVEETLCRTLEAL